MVETALALSGSAAQSKIQSYPGDCDYFERINIIAPTREEACQILAKIMREKALNTLQGPTYQLIEVKFGSYPEDMVIGDRRVKAGTPIAWKPDQIRAGKIEGFRPGWHAGQRRHGMRSVLRQAGASWIGWSLTRSASSCPMPAICWM